MTHLHCRCCCPQEACPQKALESLVRQHTNQPQVLHTSTARFTDKTCLMTGAGGGRQRDGGRARPQVTTTAQPRHGLQLQSPLRIPTPPRHGLQLQSLLVIPAAAASLLVAGPPKNHPTQPPRSSLRERDAVPVCLEPSELTGHRGVGVGAGSVPGRRGSWQR